MAGMYLILYCDSDCNTALYCLHPVASYAYQWKPISLRRLLAADYTNSTILIQLVWNQMLWIFYAHQKKKLKKNVMCKVKKRPRC